MKKFTETISFVAYLLSCLMVFVGIYDMAAAGFGMAIYLKLSA